MSTTDAAALGELTRALHSLLPALESFNRFEGSDSAAQQRDLWTEHLDLPLPEIGEGLDAVLSELATTIIPFGLRNGAPGFAGWVTTAPTTSGTAAALAATVGGSMRWWVQPFNYLETIALRWLAELCHIPPSWQGTFTSGGSVANVIGLGAARQRAGERLGIDAARDGLPAGSRWRVYASEETHRSIVRAAGVLGLGRRSATLLPVDSRQRIDVARLREVLAADRAQGTGVVALVANAGTVNTGAVDPIAPLVELARQYDTWLHIDGAYGMFGILDSRVEKLFSGLDQADSVVVDPHKWMAAPVGCGAVFVRDRTLLGRAFTMEPAAYLEGAQEATASPRSPFDSYGELFHDFNLEQSAPSRGTPVWAILKEIGKEGMRRRVGRHLDFARRLAECVRAHDRLELLAEPTLSICCFRYRPPGYDEAGLDELNTAILAALRGETEYVPSSTRVSGRLAIRACYINPRTTLAQVEGLPSQVARIGDRLARADRDGAPAVEPASRGAPSPDKMERGKK